MGNAAVLSKAPPQTWQYLNQNRHLLTQRAVLGFPYYSAVRLPTTRTGAGPFTYTGPTTPSKAFGYKIGGVMDDAGFPTGTIATMAETNILQPGATRDNADVLVWGWSVEIMKGDPKLLRDFFRQCAMLMSLSGTDTYQVGRLSFFPQTGGLFGLARTALEAGQLVETSGPLEGQLSNGNPNAGSQFLLPDPVLWQSIGSNNKDVNLSIQVKPERAVVATSTDRAAVAGAAPGVSGRVEAFTSPANQADGTFVDLCIRLSSVSFSARSNNA